MQKATYPPLRTHKKLTKGQLGLHIFFILLSLCYVLPLILLISISFDGSSVTNFSLIPKVFTLNAYKMVFATPGRILNGYKVTTFYSVFGTLSSLVVMMMFAYSISRPNFVLRNPLTFILFFTTLFSGGLVPSYLLNTRYLHLNNTIWIYILPSMISAWNVIVIKTYLKGLSVELFEAARLDGASELRICFTIILPLSTPVLASVGFLDFINRWNNWYTSQIYITKPELRSLQYLLKLILDNLDELKSMQQEGSLDQSLVDVLDNLESVRFAMAVVAAGPMRLIFPFFQKYFAKGMTIGAVKG